MIKEEIIADSINEKTGDRLTSWVLTYPRFIHSEVMTHRVFSRNAASSRAIPSSKLIEMIQKNPAVPEHWGKNQSGMQAKEELDDTTPYWHVADHFCGPFKGADGVLYEGSQSQNHRMVTKKGHAEHLWLEARDLAIEKAKRLEQIGLHKQIANRILEPWMHMTIILSGTEYENFFALRADKDAQPEFQKLAYMMLDLYNEGSPRVLSEDFWHVPFGENIDEDRVRDTSFFKSPGKINVEEEMHFINEAKIRIATARCARVSYVNFEGKDDYEADLKLYDRLLKSGHMSPFEHCAKVTYKKSKGNFKGFEQLRHSFKNENRSDPRVVK